MGDEHLVALNAPGQLVAFALSAELAESQMWAPTWATPIATLHPEP